MGCGASGRQPSRTRSWTDDKGGSPTNAENLYRTHVENFKLFEMTSERDGPTRITMFGQFLSWKDGRREPAASKRQVEEAPDRRVRSR
jgi:hypothetical protein